MLLTFDAVPEVDILNISREPEAILVILMN